MSRITLMIESCHDNSSLVGMTVNKLCSEVFPEGDVWSIELSVIEAINNAIKHAYKGHPDGIITVVIEFKDNAVFIDIKDRGQTIPQEILENLDVDKVFDFDTDQPCCFPECGMGLALMKESMDRVDYQSSNGINTLRLVKNMNSAHESAQKGSG